MPLVPSSLVTTDWLAEHLADDNLVVLDASWFLPGATRNPQQEWSEKRIPGARYFDFDKKIAAPNTQFPHMLPSPELFEKEVSELGISNGDAVIVYDTQGLFSAPRVWWMFKAMGHKNVAVLDGGFPAWLAGNNPIESGELIAPEMTFYKAAFESEWVIDADTLESLLEDHSIAVIDARGAARFFGTEPEPRQGVRGGHMPNAKSLPFSQLIKNGFFIDKELLINRFNAVSDTEQRLIFSCGSGVTACVLALGAELAGRKMLTVYDGSWTEWGSTYKYPVIK
jgi:thiosulfate/3-mercaptopyruvate sulfurtransferase